MLCTRVLTNHFILARLDLVNIMITTNIYQAKTQLSKLISQVEEGKEVVIAKAGKPVAKLVAYKEKRQPRKLGLWKGKVWISDDFDKEDPEINRLFYGE